jgi:hypothetical protein
MSQQDNFLGGFLVGTVVGGVVGGILGAVVASRINKSGKEEEFPSLDDRSNKKKRHMAVPNEQSIEAARRGLEDKIAQLNEAIDDARQQLSNVNGVMEEDVEGAIVNDSSN